jgi:hypothetical protein
MTTVGFDTSVLLNYYSAQTSMVAARASSSTSRSTSSSSSSKNSATANDVTPWSEEQASQESRDAEVMMATSFIDTSDVPQLAGSSADSKLEQDNQKLFALYKAVNNLSYLATMSKRDGVTAGQMAGYNTRFQAGLEEIEKYIATEGFNNFTLQAQEPSSSVTSSAAVPTATFDYTGSVLASGNTVNDAVSGLSTSDSFTVTVKKDGVSQDVNIDLSKVEGDLTMGNIVTYVNKTLSSQGFSTRFKKVLVSGDVDAATTATKTKQQYSLQIDPGGTEQVSLSANSTPSLYFSSTSGLTTSTTTTDKSTSTLTTTAADNQARLVKLSNLDDPTAEFSRTTSPTSGTTTASSTVTDASGNVYMLGNATGDLSHSQLNQGDQDVYLTKYDSAGNTLWSKLVGSAGTADGTAMALDPNGGVVVVGSTTAKLTTGSVTDGNQDSFVVKYDNDGNQTWTTQIQTLNTNSATSVSVDGSGNVYIGGQTKGVVGSGQTSLGGQDAYLAEISSKGKVVSEKQFGTSSADTVSATAMTDSGDLLVASVQNGHAILSKYAGGDVTATPAWTMDMGDLQTGGGIGGIAVSGDKIYVSGTTSNGALNATAATTASGSTDAFVFAATDNGSSVTADHVSYVGTSAIDNGAGLTVGSDGTVYMVGSTNGTFDGQSRNSDGTSNAMVAAIDTSGSVSWVRQYGGLDGQSIGTGITYAETGSSVLDALGLPSGTVSGQQNSYLSSATTLRAGDFFNIQIEGDAERTFKITIDKNETLSTLVTKINSQLGSKGKASVSYTSGGAALKIEVSAGVTAKLLAGTTDTTLTDKSSGTSTTITGSSEFDALSRLGLSPQTLSKAATDSTDTSSSSTDSYALGLSSNLDISTSTAAGAARAQLLNVLSAIQKIYQSAKTAATDTTSTTSSTKSTSSKLSAALTTYNSNVNTNASVALSILSA